MTAATEEDSEVDQHRQVIRADTLRELCTGTGAGSRWKVRDGICVSDAQVMGCLDLSGTELPHAIRFRDCTFDEPVDLRQAHAKDVVEWQGGKLPGLLADQFESESDLVVRGVVIDAVSLQRAHVGRELRLTGSHLAQPGGQAMNGSNLWVGGTLFLDDLYAEGEVCLRSAHVQGEVNCRHARFDNPSGRSIDGGHLVVDGEILLQGYHDDTLVPSHYGTKEDFHSDGEVCLQWAQVHRLRATGGKFASATTFALHADALRAKDGVYLDRGFKATAEVRLVGAYITGELCCTGGSFDNPIGLALDAERIVAEDVYLDRGFTAKGQVRFTDAQVKRQFNATGGEFRNDRAGEYALDADGLVCGGEVFLNEGFHAVGAVSLTGAEIHGELNCTAGSFRNPDGYALFADGLTTPGMVYLDHGFRAIGEVRFARATVGSQLKCTDGTFDNQHGIALDITGVVCQGDVLLKSTGSEGRVFRATGEICIRDAQITRDLDVTNARLHGDEGLDARGMRVGGCMTWMLDQPAEGFIDLTDAQVGQLKDTIRSWGRGKYILSGLSLASINRRSSMTPAERKQWLLGATDCSPQLYQKFLESYRLSGNEVAAEEILIAQQRNLRRRGKLRKLSRIWNWFLDYTVGYGYRLHRVVFAVLAMVLIGWGLFFWGEHARLIIATNGSHMAAPACPAGIPCFNSFIYSFQLLVPVIDLRETAAWAPNSASKPWGMLLMSYTWLMIAVGWVVGVALAAGVGRYFRAR